MCHCVVTVNWLLFIFISLAVGIRDETAKRPLCFQNFDPLYWCEKPFSWKNACHFWGKCTIPLPFAAEPIVNVLLLLVPLEVLLLVGRESEGGVCTVLKELGQ